MLIPKLVLVFEILVKSWQVWGAFRFKCAPWCGQMWDSMEREHRWKH